VLLQLVPTDLVPTADGETLVLEGIVGEFKLNVAREAYTFLHRKGRRNSRHVPCITRQDGKRITTTEERDRYGFEHVVLYRSTTMWNCARMEQMLHDLYKDEPFGTRRGWRIAGAGQNYPDAVREEKTFALYLTYSEIAHEYIASEEIIEGDREKTRKHDESHGRKWNERMEVVQVHEASTEA
jgi:hypothetical protein